MDDGFGDASGIMDAATGAVAAQAVEPDVGGPSAHGAAVGACLNCGTPRIGAYCHQCGQAEHVHRTLSAFGHDLLHGVLHFEGKIWRTLPMLAWRPGELTRRYIAGERARFVSPLALFLFSIFLTFAVIGWTGGPFGSVDEAVRTDAGLGIAKGIESEDRKIARLEKRRIQAIIAGAPVDKIDKTLKEARDSASMLRLIKQRGITEATFSRASDDVDGAPAWINAAYRKAKANPTLLLYKLQNSAYKYSWALIPISVPFFWLLFPFSRQFRMYDHAVFVTYSLCFMTLLVIVASIAKAARAPEPMMAILMLIVPIVHMYRQMRGTYALRRWSAALRTFVLIIICIATSTLFAAMLLGLGLLG